MSYQVLARKYRPANFQELEGQEHVLRALVNALDNDRLHHAYLFTGTRGVGKTTIARILAKCLNCEEGVSAKPCGECSTCVEIAEGRSVDLIEVDAASRTKVEDTRELLDNVQYMPTRNRFKVYLIDEVQMLSNHSFNALLKTLEEPPEHVKFLLATTDPKKLPVTVLSRCLQFNLKNLSAERVVKYLRKVLTAEDVAFEESALWQLGRAADGSMRDALSLTDQAISFGNNSVNDEDVKTMLGSIDHREVHHMINCLIEKDAGALLDKISALAEFAPDYTMLLSELLSVLHRVAVAQAVPDSVDNSQGDQELVLAVAESMSREDVQLFYQIGLIGQRDLPFSPEPRTGFEMIVLRMLAFTPSSLSTGEVQDSADLKKKTATLEKSDNKVADAIASLDKKTENKEKASNIERPDQSEQVELQTSEDQSVSRSSELQDTAETAETEETEDPEFDPSEVSADSSAIPVDSGPESAEDAAELEPKNWVEILPKLGLTGVTLSLASNCVLRSVTGPDCQLVLNEHHASLWNNAHETRIGSALSRMFGTELKVSVTIGQPEAATPAEVDALNQQKAHARAVELIENDEKVKQIVESFDGRLERETIAARQKKTGD